MQIFPAIELRRGKCVSLNRGRLDEAEIWHVDPVRKAREFAQAGAEWLHVTDLDSVAGEGNHNDLLKEIIRKSETAVQLAGGFRSAEMIDEWIDLGAARIVLGSLAVTHPQIVKTAARRHPDQIVVAVDVFDGHVMTDGWRRSSAFAPDEFIGAFAADPLAAIVITDIRAYLGDTEEPLSVLTRLAEKARAPVIAQGLSRSLDDLSRLKYVPGIAGAILGRPLYDRSIRLEDALALGNSSRERTAEFI